MTRLYKYTPRDFKELDVKVVHMDLNFNVYDNHTDVLSVMKLKNKNKPLKEMELNAKNIDLYSIDCNLCEIKYAYKKEDNKIIIKFIRPIPKNKDFIIKTISSCKPTNNVLEGLYYDVTKEGCPPTMITQCQQWGFQRIVPSIDDMTAKCTYRTTITADSRYTHIITNGDIIEPRKDLDNGRSRIVYDNSKTPMAPYLFFLGVGCYDEFKKEFEYPDGNKFMIEFLLPPGSDKERAGKALDIIHNCVEWIYIFTGPEMYKHLEKKKEIESLMRKRDHLKSSGDHKEAEKIRQKLKSMIKGLSLGYKYTGTVYREIGMQNSDFGGMENVGNTTITTNRIMPFKDMTDGSFEYMIKVKVHEYYHNINGSEVTGKDPFQLWLNEAVTVYIEQLYMTSLLGEDYLRLTRVLSLISPNGVFNKDSGATTMPIIPSGFNDPNELISLVTYVKSPEFIRMLELMIGKDNFAKGLANYHKKYSHANADSGEFISELEKVSKMKLKRMAKVWLEQTGYPIVNVKYHYDEKKRQFKMHLSQKGYKSGMHWEFPFVFALVDEDGKDIIEKQVIVNKPKADIILNNVNEPAFVSLNRGYSFYGKVVHDTSIPELVTQVEKDSDIINKYMAFYHLLDLEKTELLADPKRKVSDSIVELFYRIISDKDLSEKLGALMLSITEYVEDEKYAYQYKELYEVRKKILKAIAQKHKRQLVKLYQEMSIKHVSGDYVERELKMMKIRHVKNMCLMVLSQLDTPDGQAMVKKQFNNASSATDKVTAFSLYINSSAKDKMKILEKYEEESSKNLVSHESFLAVVGANNSDDALSIIKKVEKTAHFRIEQANDQRSLYNTFALNRKRSILTKEGLEFMKDTLLKLSEINEYTVINCLEAFNKINNIDKKYQPDAVKCLIEIMKKVDPYCAPSVYNTTRRILIKSPDAVKAYEKKYGRLGKLLK